MFNFVKKIIKITKVRLKDKTVQFESGANFSLHSEFGGHNMMRQGAWLNGCLGYGSYVGQNSWIEGKVGKYCSISQNVRVLIGNHPVHRFVSTSPCFFSLAKQNGMTYITEPKFQEEIYADENNKYGVIIGNDVWIGYGATIMGGVTIGDGAIIGANSYVNKDVEPYSVVAGIPAKKIKMRFNDDQIQFLKKVQWWNKPESWIKEHVDLFDDIDVFIKNVDNRKE